MTARRLLGVLHVAVGAFLLFTLVYQIVDLNIGGGFVATEYFAYFTVLSMFLTVLLLVWTGVSMLRRATDSVALTSWAWAIVPVAMVTAIVYNVTLRGRPTDVYLGQPWENEVLHVGIPAFLVVDWFLLRLLDPGRPRLRWPAALVALVFPTVWVVLTMLRGLLLDGWFPYPFLEPDGPDGVPGILAYVVGIFLFIELTSVAGIAVTRTGRRAR